MHFFLLLSVILGRFIKEFHLKYVSFHARFFLKSGSPTIWEICWINSIAETNVWSHLATTRPAVSSTVVSFFTPLVWCGQVSNPQPPAPEVDAQPFALSGQFNQINRIRPVFFKQVIFCVTNHCAVTPLADVIVLSSHVSISKMNFTHCLLPCLS